MMFCREMGQLWVSVLDGVTYGGFEAEVARQVEITCERV